jgi:hypothetical protein
MPSACFVFMTRIVALLVALTHYLLLVGNVQADCAPGFYDPVDAPIKIESPVAPLATNVFTLLHNEKASTRWNVVSMPGTLHGNATGSG